MGKNGMLILACRYFHILLIFKQVLFDASRQEAHKPSLPYRCGLIFQVGDNLYL
jgi:hypothetical protein